MAAWQAAQVQARDETEARQRTLLQQAAALANDNRPGLRAGSAMAALARELDVLDAADLGAMARSRNLDLAQVRLAGSRAAANGGAWAPCFFVLTV